MFYWRVNKVRVRVRVTLTLTLTLTLAPNPNCNPNKSGLTSVDYVAKYEMIVTAR